MEVVSIERSAYEELLTSFNSFVTKMKEMANRGNDKGLSDWLDNQDVDVNDIWDRHRVTHESSKRWRAQENNRKNPVISFNETHLSPLFLTHAKSLLSVIISLTGLFSIAN